MERFLSVQSRGTIALPPEVRRRRGLDVPGAQVELIEREDGVIEIHPHVPAEVVALEGDAARFVAGTLIDPPSPNRKLRAAMARYRERMGETE